MLTVNGVGPTAINFNGTSLTQVWACNHNTGECNLVWPNAPEYIDLCLNKGYQAYCCIPPLVYPRSTNPATSYGTATFTRVYSCNGCTCVYAECLSNYFIDTSDWGFSSAQVTSPITFCKAIKVRDVDLSVCLEACGDYDSDEGYDSYQCINKEWKVPINQYLTITYSCNLDEQFPTTFSGSYGTNLSDGRSWVYGTLPTTLLFKGLEFTPGLYNAAADNNIPGTCYFCSGVQYKDLFDQIADLDGGVKVCCYCQGNRDCFFNAKYNITLELSTCMCGYKYIACLNSEDVIPNPIRMVRL